MGVVSSEYLVKGTATLVSRDWLDERLGEGWFHATAREKFSDWPERLLPNEYYPLPPQMHAWREAAGRIEDYASVESMVHQAAAATAERDLRTIYKAFLWVTKPSTFLMAVPRLWSSYVRFGTLETLENTTGCYRASITGIPEDLLEWAAGAIAGFLHPALLLAGGQEPDSKVRDRRKNAAGDWDIDYQLSYRL